ncbi:MAG: serine/threonine-protein kinase [Gemmataceae bacterium]
MSDDATPSAGAEFQAWAKPAEPGEQIGEFQVLRLLGKGGYAHVYLAWQPSMQRTVALKVSADRGTESQTLAQLDHPNIVRVFDQRLLPGRRTRLLYMSFVGGGTLWNVLDHICKLSKDRRTGADYVAAIESAARSNGIEVGPRTAMQDRLAQMTWPATIAWIGARLANALDYAHRKGVLHRDVKPANVLLTPQGQPQLADFNVGSASLSQPAPDAIFGGSLPYMSPEHLEGLHPYLPRTAREVDARSDIYALGMTLWELLAGERPFADEKFGGDLDLTIDALLESRRAGVPQNALASLPANCPQELVRVLRKCLEPDPKNRYSVASELAQDLDLCHDPEALALLWPKAGGWRAWVRRTPATWVFLIGLAPNLVTSLLNIHYNHAAVISNRPDAEALFWKLVQIINSIFFPIGLGIFVAAIWPVARTVRKRDRGEVESEADLAWSRLRCLRLGPIAGRTCVTCWVIAGVVWPLTLDYLAGRLSLDAHLHFLASLTICGLIAAVHPFFLVSLVSVRALMPTLLWHSTPTPAEGIEIQRLERALGRNLLLSAAVPLIGVAALVTIDAHDRTSMLAVTFLGLAGCVLAYVLDRGLRADLAALMRTYFSKST